MDMEYDQLHIFAWELFTEQLDVITELTDKLKSEILR